MIQTPAFTIFPLKALAKILVKCFLKKISLSNDEKP